MYIAQLCCWTLAFFRDLSGTKLPLKYANDLVRENPSVSSWFSNTNPEISDDHSQATYPFPTVLGGREAAFFLVSLSPPWVGSKKKTAQLRGITTSWGKSSQDGLSATLCIPTSIRRRLEIREAAFSLVLEEVTTNWCTEDYNPWSEDLQTDQYCMTWDNTGYKRV